MSETTVEQASEVEAPEVETDETAENFDAKRAMDKIAKANSEAKGLRSRVKELETYEAKVRELEESQKSEQQKVIERAEKAEQDANAARSELIRERIARRHGIADEDMDLLGSGTEEEIEGRAKRLAALSAAAAGTDETPAPPTSRTAEKLRPGASPKTPTEAPKSYPAGWLPAAAESS